MAIQNITRAELSNWETKYLRTIKDTDETRSCLISLADINQVLDKIKRDDPGKRIDGFRVYFHREKLWAGALNIKNPLDPTNVVAQLNIAMVPTYGYQRNFDPRGAGALNYIDNGSKLLIVVPGDLGSEHSGLCPPNCAE